MSAGTPGPSGGNGQGLAVGGIALLVLAAAGGTWLPVALTHPPGYTGQPLFAAAAAVATGTIRWTLGCTLIAAGEVLLLLLAVGLIVWARGRRHDHRRRIDRQARRMASRRELAHLSPNGVADSARRLRPSLADAKTIEPDAAGVLIGHTVIGTMPLRQSWEDMAVDIWGPRTGKTTARAIPAIVAAPGPVLVTSVKGDIVDATHDPRAVRGRIWVFDLQDLWGRPRRMWVDLLGGITTITQARRLAEHFAAAEREPGVQRDAFFDPKSEDLVANLLLAAAVSGRTILDPYRWATNHRDDTPARLLREHGYDLPAQAVEGVLNLPDKTRGGIYGGAEKALMCLTEPSVSAWVTPPADPGIKKFEPTAFVGSTDTLYLLSQGGPGSPAPLVAALTDAVLRAGESRARTSASRRLDPPLLSVLDEACNICRLRQLPNLYSYYGSLGLPVIAILQSYAQGVDVWGREGMRKLWSSANIRTYGGGVADPDFLEELAKLIGDEDIITRSTSSTGLGWGEQTVSRSPRRQRVLDVADLHALPRGRMVVYSSGARPVMARTAPWQKGSYAEQVRASIAHWDPDQHTDWTLDDIPLDDDVSGAR